MATSTAPAGGSMPATATEPATGSHVMKIPGDAVDFGGNSVSSDPFRVGGHSWRMEMECFPCVTNGEEDEGEWWVSIYLVCVHHGRRAGDEDEALEARFELSLLDHAGGAVLSRSYERTFSRTDDSWGRGSTGRFIKRQELRSSPLRHYEDNEDDDDDGGGGECYYRVRCDLTVVVESSTTVEQPPQDLLRIGDVTFDVGGELITAHRCVVVLAGKENVVKIPDMEPRVFKTLLHFVNTGALPAEEGDGGDRVAMAQALLVAADRYKVERLKPICTDVLRGSIDAATAVATLQLAHERGWREVEEECAAFLKGVLAKVGQL